MQRPQLDRAVEPLLQEPHEALADGVLGARPEHEGGDDEPGEEGDGKGDGDGPATRHAGSRRGIETERLCSGMLTPAILASPGPTRSAPPTS